MTNLSSIPAKSIITKSKLPDADYVVNPYLGCYFGCSYCYANFMGRRVGQPRTSWGDYVYVKENCLAIFEKELDRLMRKKQQKTILFSSVTDPYQPIEGEKKYVKSMLELLCSKKYLGLVSILTKSPLVLRDVKILQQLPKVEVGFTLSHVDKKDSLVEIMENKAPGFIMRLKALEKLISLDIPTYAFVGPLMPHLFEDLSRVENIFKKLHEAGVKEVFVEYLNITPTVRQRILSSLDQKSHISLFYRNFQPKNICKKIDDEIILGYLTSYGMKLRMNEVIVHRSS